MRLKLLLGLMLLVSCTPAFAASQLSGLNVATSGNMTTLTLGVNGVFTHNEYRPTDNLLLVDLAGVSPAKYAAAAKELNAAGLSSYRVLEYKGVNGADVTRLELALPTGTQVKVNDMEGGVAVHLSSSAAAAPAMAAPAMTTAAPAKPAAQPVAMPAQRVTIENIGVVRGQRGVDIEITGNGVLTHKAMKLVEPDRVVIDVLNAVPARNQREIAVNSGDIKSVRIGRFQADPPITRVVVDLASDHPYDIVASGRKLTLKLATSAAAPAATPKPDPTVNASAAAAPITLAQAADKREVPAPRVTGASLHALPRVADATYRDRVTGPPIPTRAELAASRFAQNVEIPTSNLAPEPMAAKQQPVTPMQVQQQMQQQMPAQQPMPGAATAGQAQMPAGGGAMMRPASTGPRYTGEPISVNLKDVDLKDFFRLIHEISGLNIVLDPNVHGTLTLVLDEVPWDQALDIVLQNNGLDKQVEGNVLRIATIDTMKKEAENAHARAIAEAQAVPHVNYTHYFSYAHAKEVVPLVKKFLSEKGDVISDDRTNSVIVNDIPSVIPEVQRLMVQLDRKTEEVEIEARVVAATRNFARDIGTQLGFGWGNNPSAVGGAGVVGTSPLLFNGLTPKFLSLGNSIPLFSNMPAVGPSSGLSFINASNNYRLDFILTMAESRGLLKILSRPRVVTQNNIQALVRQGVKVPVVTAAQLGGPPTVSYFDAFLRLSVTPQITAERTIFLNVDVENTSPDFGQGVNGNPALVTQQAQTSVLVPDGGTVMIGGVIQTSNSVNIQQVPILGNIPALGNLFKRRAVSTRTQELIFFITPKILGS